MGVHGLRQYPHANLGMGYNLLAMLVPEVQPNCDTAPLLTPNHTESIRLRSETARRLRIESNRIFRCRNAYGGMQWAAIRHADAVTGTCLLFGRFSLPTLHRVACPTVCAEGSRHGHLRERGRILGQIL